MAQHDFAKLASQGRAFDASRAWTEDELNALLDLEKNAGDIKDVEGVPTRAGLSRTVAAEYIRNGIKTVEDYDKAMEAGFEVKSLEVVREEAVAAHQAEVRAQLGLDGEGSDDDSDGDSNDSNEDEDEETDEEKAEREKKEVEEAAVKAELDRLLALSREELEAEATALEVTFTARSKNETIANNILEAKAANK